MDDKLVDVKDKFLFDNFDKKKLKLNLKLLNRFVVIDNHSIKKIWIEIQKFLLKNRNSCNIFLYDKECSTFIFGGNEYIIYEYTGGARIIERYTDSNNEVFSNNILFTRIQMFKLASLFQQLYMEKDISANRLFEIVDDFEFRFYDKKLECL